MILTKKRRSRNTIFSPTFHLYLKTWANIFYSNNSKTFDYERSLVNLAMHNQSRLDSFQAVRTLVYIAHRKPLETFCTVETFCHGLAVPGAGCKSNVTGSIHGWIRSHLPYIPDGCWLKKLKLTSQSPSITVEFSIHSSLRFENDLSYLLSCPCHFFIQVQKPWLNLVSQG